MDDTDEELTINARGRRGPKYPERETRNPCCLDLTSITWNISLDAFSEQHGQGERKLLLSDGFRQIPRRERSAESLGS